MCRHLLQQQLQQHEQLQQHLPLAAICCLSNVQQLVVPASMFSLGCMQQHTQLQYSHQLQ